MDLEDQKYGIPELKKFPMPDAKHVRSAIRFFNYVTPKYEKQLARAILARMKEYGMSFDDFGVGEDNRFSKYIPKKDQELAHHGILGMKWGVRRYQNPDGSLTEAGKKHRAKEIKNAYNQKLLDQKKDREHNKKIGNPWAKRFNTNTLKVADKIEDEVQSTDLYKEYMKTYKKYEKEVEKFEEDYYSKYGKYPTNDFSISKDLRDKLHELDVKENAQRREIVQKYTGDLLGAMLKDLDQEDTDYGREVVAEILDKKENDSNYWYLRFLRETSHSGR